MVKSYNSFRKQKQNKSNKKPCSKLAYKPLTSLLKFVPLLLMIFGVFILSKSLMYPINSISLDPECKESIQLSKEMGFGTMLLGLGLLTNYLLYIFQQK